jgi:hypothetical protein
VLAIVLDGKRRNVSGGRFLHAAVKNILIRQYVFHVIQRI